MDVLVNEMVGLSKTRLPGRVELVSTHVRDVLNLRRLPARLTVQQTAALLNCGEHDIPVLVSNSLLQPLGRPPANAVKYFAPTDVLELAGDRERMARICDTIYEHWRVKNAARGDGNANRRSHPNGSACSKPQLNGGASRAPKAKA
jgi:hypothetical protein